MQENQLISKPAPIYQTYGYQNQLPATVIASIKIDPVRILVR